MTKREMGMTETGGVMYKKIPEETRKTAKAMLKAGKWVYEVAKALDLSRATVYRIKHENTDEDVEALANEIRKEMASRYLVLADTILRGINESEFNNASLKEKAIAAAIFTDKAYQLESKNLETGMRQGEGDVSHRKVKGNGGVEALA
jgi:transposase-like protein